MKVITAMDSFKGSLNSSELNNLITDRLYKELGAIDVLSMPISDGGEGFLDSLSSLEEYEKRRINVQGPLNDDVEVEYLVSMDRKTAIIESARIIGLNMVEDLSPFEASSYGLGEVIKDAVANGAEKIDIGLGGSATNDAGLGILKALNYHFYDSRNKKFEPDINELSKIKRISHQSTEINLKNVKFNAITDVKNIFTGDDGATEVFGKQKGLSEDDRKFVDYQVDSFRQVILNQYGTDLNQIEGTGAAGGISGMMRVFLDSRISSGIDYVLDSVGFNEHCKDANYVITGEGRIDEQTFYGKVIQGIVNRADLYNVPVIAIGGSVEIGKLKTIPNLPAIFSIINTPVSLNQAMDTELTERNLNFTIKNICKLIK